MHTIRMQIAISCFTTRTSNHIKMTTVETVEIRIAKNFGSELENSDSVLNGSPTAYSKNEELIDILSDPKRGKKRVRHEKMWKRNIRKEKRAKGKAYINVKGKLVPEKRPDVGSCPCKNNCSNRFSEQHARKLFERFYNLGSFDMQSAYIFSMVKLVTKLSTNYSRRQRTRKYYLLDENGVEERVCKTYFKNILQISDGRISRVLQSKSVEQCPPNDKRGKFPCKNKTSIEKANEVKKFIEGIPSYNSHYSRKDSPQRKYLPSDQSLGKLYRSYKKKYCDPVSYFIFSKIFNTEFNLSFHPPVSDSCRRCDAYKVKLSLNLNADEKKNLEAEKEMHLMKAKYAREGMKKDAGQSKQANDTTVIAFDLMKVLNSPVLTTGICYYKRLLKTYCLGVHDLSSNQATMYLWNENDGSKGSQEIGSCLLHYVKNYVKTKRLILYSDQCGGQNRNIKMVLLCQYMTVRPDFTPDEIHHKFLVSGHSYMACDQDFGLIEKNKKFCKNIYLPCHWKKVITRARTNKFNVEIMRPQYFFSTKTLEENTTNRKLSLRNQKVKWLEIQWLKLKKSSPNSFFFKYSNLEDDIFSEVNIKRRNSKEITDLPLLYPEGHGISEETKKDLESLLEFIPYRYRGFYENLKTIKNKKK